MAGIRVSGSAGSTATVAELRPSVAAALRLADATDLDALMQEAAALRDAAHGAIVTYSRKVFVPLTHLCRDVCHYCTFARAPRDVGAAYMSVAEAVALCREGARLGCQEALLTLGDRPEARYPAARRALDGMGFASTLDYVAHVAGAIAAETGLLPHVNAGLMSPAEIARLRPVSASMGLMLETVATRLGDRGGPHHGSPDKVPARRLATIDAAGAAQVPFTSGLLIGIGETRRERIEALLALRALHDRHGHLQEIIIQNFRAKPGTRMAAAPEPALDELLWTIAVARLVFGGGMSLQAPPNLSAAALPALIAAGINDFGGVSPLTPDHVNPEAPWPHLDRLAATTADTGKWLQQRLTIYPAYVRDAARWLDPAMRPRVLALSDAEGFAREDGWRAGGAEPLPARDLALIGRRPATVAPELSAILARAAGGQPLDEAEIVRLFAARGPEVSAVCAAADRLRRAVNGDRVSYVVNRNINYTNICGYRCRFCAFSKGPTSENLRGKPYVLDTAEVVRRAREAVARGATEVCLQGGIHPDYSGETYLEICRAIRAAAPGLHIHAFSPLEIFQGAATLGIAVPDFLRRLKAEGLDTLPGTAAEILDDEVREVICPDKISTAQWLEVVGAAHDAGIRTTATIMFGHVDRPWHWARHLIRIRELQRRSGGFTEFVPLPFVAAEAPLHRKGQARPGPTFREALLMHAVARLTLHGLIDNIQASWVKLGLDGVVAMLAAGANDAGGTLMNESITRAAGAVHGEEMTRDRLDAAIRGIGRVPAERTTLYGAAPDRAADVAALELA
jgi:FO synthase